MDWNIFQEEEKQKQYYSQLITKIKKDVDSGKIIYPKSEDIFNSFLYTPFNKVKVVILGQDPYHQPNQAMGLSFSVNKGIKIPPSLRNIFKEIEDDLQITCDKENGDLTRWARQGVFLLNTTLTVRQGEPNSHQNYGWKFFTANALSLLNKDDRPKVFILWGNNARKLKFIFSNPKHLILESVHPSPLSASRGFFGCKHFSQTNNFLVNNNYEPIDWR